MSRNFIKIFLMLIIVLFAFKPESVRATELHWSDTGTFGERISYDLQGNAYCTCLNKGELNMQFILVGDSNNGHTITVASSNTNVATIADEYSKQAYYDNSNMYRWPINICGYGKSEITVMYEDKKLSLFLYVIEPSMSEANPSITKVGVTSIKISWTPNNVYDGYSVYSKAYFSEYDYIDTIPNGSSSYAIVSPKWNEPMEYDVRPFMFAPDGVTRVISDLDDYTVGDFILKAPISKIEKIENIDSNFLKVSWKADKEVLSYELYVCDKINGKYTSIFSSDNYLDCSYIYKGKKGKQYYFYLKKIFDSQITITSVPVCGFISKVSKPTICKIAIQQKDYEQYKGNYVDRDATFFYVGSKKLHIVYYEGGKIYDYTLNNKHKVINKKVINIGKHTFGGFYRSNSGKMYVATGFYNPTESNRKTVIEVVQYSSDWKKIKVCKIKANAINEFKGIREPFAGGNCSFDEKDNILYIFTARIMFKDKNGLNHQSNISFQIDTTNMTYKNENTSYCAHSFNQYVKYDGDEIYFADHGDGDPRGIQISVQRSNGECDATVVFDIIGEIGNNYTGLKLLGMECVSDNIITAGTSVPQNYSIKGVDKKKDKKIENAFVTITNKDFKSNKVIWLTKYNKKSKTTISALRLIKLSDFNFAILYSTIKNKKETLHYVVFDNNGNKVFEKNYYNMVFTGSAQPIVVDGSIVWTAEKDKSGIAYYCSIPAKIHN